MGAGGGGVGLRERLEELVHLPRRMPTPVSVTSTPQQHPAGPSPAAYARTATSPPLGELHRVRDQVGEHLRQPGRVADQHARARRGGTTRRGRAPSPGPARRASRPPGRAAGRTSKSTPSSSSSPASILEKSRMSLMSAEQGPAGALDAGGQPVLVGGQRGAEQQVVEADHAVERGADLVAHGGQELRLLARGLHRASRARGELGLRDRSRSATRASCSATRPAIVSIRSWR